MAYKVFSLPTDKLLNACQWSQDSVNEEKQPKKNKKEGKGFTLLPI